MSHAAARLTPEDLDAFRQVQRLAVRREQSPAGRQIIGQRLAISPRTVEVYRANVMMKMQARTLSELVRMVTVARLA